MDGTSVGAKGLLVMAVLALLLGASCALPSASGTVGQDRVHREVVPASTGALDGRYDWTMEATSGYMVFHAWWSSGPLDLRVYSPSGAEVDQQSAQHQTTGEFAVNVSGTYRFVWTNHGPNTVLLNFTVVSQREGAAEEVFLLSNLLCAGILVASVIVILFVAMLITRRNRSLSGARPMYPVRSRDPHGQAGAAVRSCRRCGASVGWMATVCPRCGKPLG